MNHDAYNGVKEAGFLKNMLPSLLRALLIATGVTAAVFFVAALLLTYTPLSEAAAPFIALLAMASGVVSGGTAFARAIGHKGCLCGATVGLLWALLLYAAACIISKSASACGAYSFILLAVGLFCGAIGGILGVNITARKHR